MGWNVVRLVAVLAVALVSGGCSDRPEDAAPTQTSSATPSPTATGRPANTDPFRRTPPVEGLTKDIATERLVDRGYKVRAHTVELSACAKDELVLWQQPRGGSARRVGTRVTLYVNKRPRAPVCGLDLPPPSEELSTVGRAFVGFARAVPGAGAPTNSPVDLYLGGQVVHTIPAQRARHRPAYGWLCPSAGAYAARTCPFSSVRAIDRYPGPIALTSDPPATPCGGGSSLQGIGGYGYVTLTPDEPRSCVDYFAVELQVDPTGQVTAVNLVWAEP